MVYGDDHPNHENEHPETQSDGEMGGEMSDYSVGHHDQGESNSEDDDGGGSDIVSRGNVLDEGS